MTQFSCTAVECVVSSGNCPGRWFAAALLRVHLRWCTLSLYHLHSAKLHLQIMIQLHCAMVLHLTTNSPPSLSNFTSEQLPSI